MDFEQLGETWRHLPASAAESPMDALAQVQRRALELRQVVRRRDRIEIGVALVMLPLFAWLAVVGRTEVSRVGAAIVALACLFIPLRLRAARLPQADPGQPLLTRLRQDLAQIHAQERLLSTVLWWYFAPLGAGVILFVGGTVPVAWAVVYGVVVVGIYYWLLRLNRQALRTQLGPRARELQEWISHLEQGT